MNREQVEIIIGRRCGALLAMSGMVITPTSTSDCLGDPIAWALRMMGVTPTDPTAPTSEEIQLISNSLQDKFLDYVELAALQNAANNYTGVDVSSQGESRSDDQIRQALLGAAERKRNYVQQSYGVVAPRLTQGSITLNYQQNYPTE